MFRIINIYVNIKKRLAKGIKAILGIVKNRSVTIVKARTQTAINAFKTLVTNRALLRD
jgi:ribosomal protein S13